MDKTTVNFEYPHYKTTTDEILFPEILFEAVYHSNHVYSHRNIQTYVFINKIQCQICYF